MTEQNPLSRQLRLGLKDWQQHGAIVARFEEMIRDAQNLEARVSMLERAMGEICWKCEHQSCRTNGDLCHACKIAYRVLGRSPARNG